MLEKWKENYLDLKLSGEINKKYSLIENCDIVKPPFDDKLSVSSFWLNKRKWFRPVNGLTGWTVTDVIEINNEKDGSTSKYMMRLEESTQKIKIYKIDWCGYTQIWSDLPYRLDWDYRFIKTKFVKWKRKSLFTDAISFLWADWVQNNYSWEDFSEVVYGAFKADKKLCYNREDTNWNDWIRVWDYLFVSSIDRYKSNTWISWQVAVITWSLSENELLLRTARAWLDAKEPVWTGCNYSVYPERWDVFLVDTDSWLKLWTDDSQDFLDIDFSGRQSSSLNINNGIISYINEYWYLNYGWVGTQQFLSSLYQQVFVWSDVVTAATFQEYTLLFKKDSLSVIRYSFSDTWNLTYSYVWTNLNIWIFSKYSYASYRSNFYFLWSDKRLYALSVKPTAYWTYETDLQDMSALIKWELENIRKQDKVYLQADEQELIIFQNTNHNEWKISKTKILIFNKDYQFRHRRTACNLVLISKKLNYYIWSWLFHYCGLVDWISEDTYTQKIEAYVWSADEGSQISMRQDKVIKELAFFMSYNSYISNDNFSITVDTYTNWLQLKYRMSDPEWWNDGEGWFEYIKLLKKFRAWLLTRPTEDMQLLSSGCMKYLSDCEKSGSIIDVEYTVDSETCWCPPEPMKLEDYCICYESKKYFLSPFAKIFYNMAEEVVANMYKITIEAKWYDDLGFGWLVVPYFVNSVSDKATFFPNIWSCNECDDNACICTDTATQQCAF